MDNNKKEKNISPSVEVCSGSPENVWEAVNKFGTYEIQPTADTDNEFPTIAHGNPRGKKQKSNKNKK